MKGKAKNKGLAKCIVKSKTAMSYKAKCKAKNKGMAEGKQKIKHSERQGKN